ncbi:hypothetical protein HanPSC8_Chr10g0407321 [Helianthus annuus]|nr:hypothetical protein HanPSC8_Chr10g0407321 [Helianthus annuus]
MTRIFFFPQQSLFPMKTQLGFFFIPATRNPNLTLLMPPIHYIVEIFLIIKFSFS